MTPEHVIPTVEQRANIEAALREARAALTVAGVPEARALSALSAPEYNRWTVAGRRWRAARPWLSHAWTIRACIEDLAVFSDEDCLDRLRASIAACEAVLGDDTPGANRQEDQ